MGRYRKGILGSFQGTVGTVVGSSWMGIDYMKSRSKPSKKPPTPAQLEVRAKFSLITHFTSTIGALLMTSFKDKAADMTGINHAFAYNRQNAITGTYPAFALDYTKVLISKGQLHNAVNPTATAAGSGLVKFNWTDNSGIAMANADDKCILVLYCPELNQTVYTTGGAPRNAAADVLNVGNFTGKTVETWVGFISANGVDVATSIYTGQLVIS